MLVFLFPSGINSGGPSQQYSNDDKDLSWLTSFRNLLTDPQILLTEDRTASEPLKITPVSSVGLGVVEDLGIVERPPSFDLYSESF